MKPPLVLDNLPFVSTTFHTFGGSSKARPINCDFFDATGVTAQDADSLLGQLAGMDSIKAKILGLTTRHVNLFREAVKAALSQQKGEQITQSTPLRRNVIIQGPTGVGKTVTAQALAVYMAANGIVANKRIAMLKALDLRGEFLGETNIVVAKALEFVRGGSLIIDEIDAISSLGDDTSFDAEARNHLNACMENENKYGTVVIGTGYLEGIDALFSDQPGLRERFGNIWSVPKYDAVQIGNVFDKKLELEGLEIEPSARDLAHKELITASERLGDKFGNSRTIERFVGMVVDAHSAQFSADMLEKIAHKLAAPPTDLLTISMASIPQFDVKRKEFVKGGLRLFALEAAAEIKPRR